MFSKIKSILVACIILVIISGVFQIATAATEEDMRAAMQGLIDGLNAHDTDQMSLHWTDDIVYDFVPQPPPLNGKQEAAAFFEALFRGIPDFHGVQTRILVSDNIMVTEAAVTGTHSGELSGIPATGSSLQLLALHIWEFEEDKIKQATEYLDMASMLMQMGLMPAPDLDPALLVPSFPLPDAEPTGLTPLEAFQELLARWNAQDLPGFAKMIHPDAEIFDTGLGIPVNRDAYVAAQEMNFQGFSDMHGEIVRVIDMGDGWISREVLFTGTHDGPFMGIPATGRTCTLRSAGLLRFDADGLVTDFSLYYDNLTMLAQLGLFPPPDPEANKAVVERWLELWNTQDLAIADEVFATDFVPHMPHYPDIVDVESYKAEVATAPTSIPDFHATLEDIVAEGDKVVARFTATGTAQGEFMGVLVDGVPYTNTWIVMFRFAGGKIAEEWLQYDLLGVLEQFGVMPPSRPTPESYTWGAPSEVTGDPGDPVANTAMVLYYIQKFWNEQNVAGLDNTHSPDFIAHIPVIPGNPLPFYMYKQVGLLHMAAFPDLRITIDNIIAEGDKVAARWTAAGTHQGELMGIPVSGRVVSFTGMTLHRFADGNIVENWWAYDALGMMQQITAPPDSEPPQE
jgi:steroid delta-isomerase-like uncharacterized protein